MKKALPFVVALLLLTVSSRAQDPEQPLIGSHAGYHNWERRLLTLELKDNSVYVITFYNRQLEAENTIRGNWRIEGDHVVLTDLLGAETVLRQYEDECFMIGASGITCEAKFRMNVDLKKYWGDVKKSGC